jgi:hypothetical protein
MQILDPTTYPGWDELLLSSPDAGIFHTSAWAKVLKDSYGYRPIYFAEINDSRIEKLIPLMEVNSFLTGKRGVSLPFTDYCKLIFPENESGRDFISPLLEYGKKEKWKFLEIRDGRHIMPGEPVFFYYHGHILDLSKGEKRIYADFRESTKRNIRKAWKEGVKANIENSPEAVNQFYRLHCRTRKQHGLPPQPKWFFKKIHEHIISKAHGFVVLGYCRDKAVAGGMYFQFGEKAIYKFGASDKDYQHLRANNAVMWEAIQWYSRNNFKEFCFGRTEPENEGLLQFKNGWGADERKIYYQKCDVPKWKFMEKKSNENPVLEKIVSRLPLPALKLAGSLLYRHMG